MVVGNNKDGEEDILNLTFPMQHGAMKYGMLRFTACSIAASLAAPHACNEMTKENTPVYASIVPHETPTIYPEEIKNPIAFFEINILQLYTLVLLKNIIIRKSVYS